MNSAVRINVRVLMGNALAQFQSLIGQMRMMEAAAARSTRTAGVFSGRWSKSFADIELAGKRLTQTGRILTYNFTMPAVLAFGALERQFLRNQEQATLLAQVYSTTQQEGESLTQMAHRQTDELGKLDQISTILSNTYGVAKDEVTGLMVTFGRAGQQGVQLAQSTDLALNIMRAYQVDAPKAADAILTVANAYQLTGEQTKVAMAELAVVSQNTRADFETVTAGIVKAAPAAQQAGIDIAHLASYLGVMQQAGFKGAEAGTALNFMLTRILKVTPESADLMKHLGLNIDSVAYAAANGVDKFDMIRKAIADLTGNQRALALATIFGARQAPKAIAMYGALMRAGGLYDQLLAKLKKGTDVLTQADEDLVVAMASPATKFAVMKTQIMNNFMAIANNLTPALMVLMQMLVRVSEAFKNASPRTQAWITFGIVVLALLGPLALIAGALTTLIGFLGGAVAGLETIAIALLNPWVLLAAGLAALMVFSKRFRDGMIAIFAGLARVIMQIAMIIYEAFQWMNPFARHSPSLVERTRDGVAAMVKYWTGLSPVLKTFDAAAKAVTSFGRAMGKFTEAMNAAGIAQQRADIGKVGGPGAVKAYDDLIAANKRLAATLPTIEAEYSKQAGVVDKAEAALKGANGELDAAEKKMEALRREHDKLSKAQEKLGDPQALRSQATAASNMARNLAEAGNLDLASQFAEQATAMNAQADAAEKNQAQLDRVADQIDAQSDAIDALRDKRDALAAVYDTEREKLDMIKQGYDAVTSAIKDNQAAADAAAQSAQQHLADLEAARKAAEAASKAAAGGKGPDFAAFDAAAGGVKLPDMTGAKAISPGAPGAGEIPSFDEYIKKAQQHQADLMGKLFPDPFKVVGGWLDNLKSAWKNVEAWFKGLHGPSPDVFVPHGAMNIEDRLPNLPPDWAKPINDSIERLKETFAGFGGTLDLLKAKFSVLRVVLQQGWAEFSSRIKKPLEEARQAVGDAFGVILDIVNDVIKVVGGRLMQIFDVLYDFWRTNGREIGVIVGVVAGFFIDWYVFLLKLATFAAKVLWPVFRMGLDGIMQIFKGVFQVVAGVLQVIIQLLTGDFSSAWDGVKKIISGLGNIIVGLGKALIAALVGFLVWLAADFLVIIGSVFGKLGELAFRAVGKMGEAFASLAIRLGEALIGLPAKIVEHAPAMIKALGEDVAAPMARYFWEMLTRTASALWNFVGYIGELILQFTPKVVDDFLAFAKKIPEVIWDGIKWGFEAYIDFYKFIGDKIIEWTPKILDSFLTFAKKIPGKIWEGIKAVWETSVTFVSHVLAWIGSKEIAIFDRFIKFGKDLPGKIWDGIKAAWEGAVTLVSHISTWIGQKEIAIFKDFAELGREIPGHLWSALKDAWGKVIDLGGWIGAKVNGATNAVVTQARELGSDLITQMKDKITERVNALLKFGKWIGEKIDDSVEYVVRQALGMGSDIIGGLVQGIINNAGRVRTAVVNAAKGALSGALDFFKIGSPSKLMRDEVGARLMEGMAIGIDREAGLVSHAMVGAARAAYDQLAAVQAAQMTMPTLVQNVRLNYLDQPLTNLSGMSSTINGGTLTAPQGAGGPQTLVQDIDLNLTQTESADPMAMAQTMAWAMRTQVT